MATVSKTNTDTAILSMKATPAACAKNVFVSFTHARDAALLATYSVIVYLFNVNHFRSATDEHYLSRNDAVKWIKEQLAIQTSVKNGMLDRYVTIGNDLFGRLNNDKHMALINQLSKLDNETVGTGPELVKKYLKDKAGIESFADAMRQIGYSTGHDKPASAAGGGKPEEADKRVADNVTNAIKALTEKAHVPQRTAVKRVAQNIVNAMPDTMPLVEQSLNRMTDVDDLLKVIELANKLIDKLNAASEGTATRAPRTPRTPKKRKGEAEATA